MDDGGDMREDLKVPDVIWAKKSDPPSLMAGKFCALCSPPVVKRLSLQPRSIPLLKNKKMKFSPITRKLNEKRKTEITSPAYTFLRWPISVTSLQSSLSTQQYFLFIHNSLKMMCTKG